MQLAAAIRQSVGCKSDSLVSVATMSMHVTSITRTVAGLLVVTWRSYVDDGWSSKGPSEMDPNSIQKMGMTASDVTDMISAWSANVRAWRQAIYDAGLFEWFMVYGGQQTAPGWSQTEPNSTCLSFMRKNIGGHSPSQNGTMFFGYSRFAHSQAWGPGGSLLSPTQDLAAFLITRGPWAWFVSRL